ncbi:E3 ubiquitin-protein ligase rnf146-like [Oppia nitens]|uniref:E3 ubiquitin-protein ligase rnf146-like n=1 Tax=Oppia nitens TaxID=1686743 RepID=UPI0023DCD72A|nr:E3 ubiquitin-protein ligase rnf146-like [Oppia nitens]
MTSESPSEVIDCAICLDVCLNGVRLDCNHIFCYLCVKGSAQQSNNRCPVCRRPIDLDFFENPTLIGSVVWKNVVNDSDLQWQYEGRNGWWLYDERTQTDIEKAFAANQSSVDVLITGFVYVIDFEAMVQYRRNNPIRTRRIRRQALDPKDTKGVAGLRTQFNPIEDNTTQNTNETHCHSESRSEETIVADNSVANTTVTDVMDDDIINLERRLNALLAIDDNVKETYL